MEGINRADLSQWRLSWRGAKLTEGEGKDAPIFMERAMTTGPPKNEAPQPEQVKTAQANYLSTIERIYMPEDLPQDDRSGIYAPDATSTPERSA